MSASLFVLPAAIPSSAQTFRWSAHDLVVLGVFSAAAKLSTLVVALAGGGINPVTLLLKNLIFTTMLVVMLYKVRTPGTLVLFVLVNMLISMLLLGGSITLLPSMLGGALLGEAAAFAAGDHVDVTGISKGHGYAGVVKRHGAHTLKATHGTGPVGRHAGSMGSGTDPSRIFKGKIGAGHMGVDQVTVMNLDVVKVDPELNMIVVRGAVPGPKGGLVTIRSTAKTIIVKKGDAGISANPQKASARVNPQKASARR